MADEIKSTELTDDILLLNRDVEHLVIQAGAKRCPGLGFDDKYDILQFVHFSDIHYRTANWNRVIRYINHYSDYFDFALHSGDFVGHNQDFYVDLYNEGDPCKKVIYNCVGNHDTYATDMSLADKAVTKSLIFTKTDDWDVVYCDCEASMTYYKDFPKANVRMIVLDIYYSIPEQQQWLAEVLEDARQKGLCVFTVSHEPTGYIQDTFHSNFYSMNNFNANHQKEFPGFVEPEYDYFNRPLFEKVIADFIAKGGIHICHLAGDHHHDGFGTSKLGVVNSIVPCAMCLRNWCDGNRVFGTKTQDCFNVVSIDTNLGLFKIVRVGDNFDNHLRSRTALCFDYINKKVISSF